MEIYMQFANDKKHSYIYPSWQNGETLQEEGEREWVPCVLGWGLAGAAKRQHPPPAGRQQADKGHGRPPQSRPVKGHSLNRRIHTFSARPGVS